jgi:hypothetical protein
MSQGFAKHLTEAKESFGKVVDFGMRVSLELNGKPATDQSALASVLHTKMCINGTTILHTLKAALTDHSAVIALCRMLMDAAQPAPWSAAAAFNSNRSVSLATISS